MKRFLLGLFVAISISVYGATVLWPNGTWLETFQNGFLFGNGSVFSALDSVPTFDNRRLDDAPKDRVYFQDFEGASVSFTCGTNLTKADDSSTPLNESTSATFTQGATPPTVGILCEGPTVTLPLKAQSKNLVEVCFQATWDGNDNEMALNIDDGGADLVQVPISASSTAKKHCGYFSTDSTTSIDFDIEVIAQNANAILEIDDLEIKVDPLAATDIYASSEWESYTPTGSFTNTTYSGRWKRDGDDLVLVIRAVGTGTPAAATGFTASLPSGLVADVDKLGNAVNTAFNYVGHGYVTDAGTNANRHSGRVYLTSTTSINLVVDEGTTFTSTNVFTFTTSDQVHMMARIPIAGWRDTAQGVVVKNLESSDVASANEFSAVIQNNGTATVVSESHSGFFTVTRVSQGVVRVDLPSGVFVNDLPHVTATVSAQSGSTYTGTRSAEYYGVTNNQFFVTTKFSDASSNNVIDYDFTIEVSKQGTDFVKESERVFTVPFDFFPKTKTLSSISSGSYTGGELKISRLGNQVTISASSTLTHANLTAATSASGLIPSWARPSSTKSNIYLVTGGALFQVSVAPDGTLSTNYLDQVYSGTGRTGTTSNLTITYFVD